ncbi:MAG: hypothetical protein IJM21_04910 [Clostridia bacterium]|nr:hypothetical protein [Clostridia bacterium]
MKKILAGGLTAVMLGSLLFSCGKQGASSDLFAFSEEDAEILDAAGEEIYVDTEDLYSLEKKGDEILLRSWKRAAVLREDFTPGEWKTDPTEDFPRAAYGKYTLKDRILLIGEKEVSLPENDGEDFMGFWEIRGTTYLVGICRNYARAGEDEDAHYSLYPLSDRVGSPLRVDAFTDYSMALGSDGKWNYAIKRSHLFRTDGEKLQDLGSATSFGVNPNTLRGILPMGDKVLLISGKKLILLQIGEKKAEGSGPDQSEVSLGVLLGPTPWLSELLSLYNAYADHRVEMIVYGSVEDLNLAILSGEIDMVSCYDPEIMREYAKRGLLSPWEEVLDGEALKKNVFPNILKAGQIGGKTYILSDRVRIGGMLLPKGAAKAHEGGFSSVKDLVETVDGMGNDRLFRILSRAEVLEGFIRNGMSSWIDADQGTCRFEEESFIELLEFCGRFAPDAETAMANQVADGVSPFLSDFDAADPWSLVLRDHYERQPEYGKDGILVPSPTNMTAGYYIVPDQTYGLVKNGEAREDAGGFMEWILSEESQKRVVEEIGDCFGMPVRIDSYQELTETMKTADKEGYTGLSDQELEDYYREYERIYQGAEHYYVHGNSAIAGMIREEANRYFSGEVTAEKAAEYIQNRVSIYLAEQG